MKTRETIATSQHHTQVCVITSTKGTLLDGSHYNSQLSEIHCQDKNIQTIDTAVNFLTYRNNLEMTECSLDRILSSYLLVDKKR